VSIQLQRKGILIVVSSPSGGGKSTILRQLLAGDPTLDYSVSTTTRPPRSGELDGEAYFFVSDERFDQIIREGRFYEWAHVHGYRYGTRRDIIEEKLARGRDVLLDLDTQGALSVKRLAPDSVIVFLLPPSMEVLEQRLRARNLDSDETIELRLKNARDEIACAENYDYIVINDKLSDTVETVRAIIRAERHRPPRSSPFRGI
jgi:guanylate kinase